MKDLVDTHRRDVTFEEGDLVFVKLKPYRLTSLARRINEKLALHYYSSFKVLKKVGLVAYQLELPPTKKIHSVFHVSVLKKVVGMNPSSSSIPSAFLLICNCWWNMSL